MRLDPWNFVRSVTRALRLVHWSPGVPRQIAPRNGQAGARDDGGLGPFSVQRRRGVRPEPAVRSVVRFALARSSWISDTRRQPPGYLKARSQTAVPILTRPLIL